MDPAIIDTEKAPTSPEKCHSDVVFRANRCSAARGVTLPARSLAENRRLSGAAVSPTAYRMSWSQGV